MKYVFFAHFNRVNMQRGNPDVWTVHFRGVCHQCRGFVCRSPIVTQYKYAGHMSFGYRCDCGKWDPTR